MQQDEDDYIIEYVVIGGSMKVTAFNTRTLHEASIVCSAGAAREDMARLAIRKLNYVQRQKDKS